MVHTRTARGSTVPYHTLLATFAPRLQKNVGLMLMLLLLPMRGVHIVVTSPFLHLSHEVMLWPLAKVGNQVFLIRQDIGQEENAMLVVLLYLHGKAETLGYLL
jgi:hypothetical protein